MPENLSQLEEMNSSTSGMDSPSNLSVSYELVRSTADHELSRSDRTMSVESLNTILSKLPEISIPATLCNPLPLQCIAANALPENVKAEINGVIAQYTDDTNALPGSETSNARADDEGTTSTTSLAEQEEEKDVDTLTAALHRALGIEVSSYNVYRNYLEFNFTGGCNCSKCQQIGSSRNSRIQENYSKGSSR